MVVPAHPRRPVPLEKACVTASSTSAADTARGEPPDGTDPVAVEQPYVTMLYGKLDERRAETAALLARVLRDETTGTPQAVSERDAAAQMYSEQLATLSAVEQGLCFGRLDLDPDRPPPPPADGSGEQIEGLDQDVLYVGRLGLLDAEHDYEPLLVDWRAPAARPYYTATAASPDGVRRRRHIRSRSRRVTAVDDEVLDLAEAARLGAATQRTGLTGEAVLLAALSAGRTGRMGDIVATIQGEQDRVIRSGANGVVVVEGGPGTGKTAVALHRAAYLLYTHRRQLARRGVLVVGPNPTFLRYIEQVLPSLGETSVLLSTVGELYPGLAARRAEPAEAAALKGHPEMTRVLSTAVRDRQELPRRPIELVVDGEKVVVDRDVVAHARTRARRTRRPHNDAKRTFVREVVDQLARREVERVGRDLDGRSNLLDRGDLADVRAGLRADPDLRAVLDELWPTLTPPQLLADLWTTPQRLRAATRGWSDADRALLGREALPADLLDGGWWSPADAVLLDEVAELLGEDDTAAREAEERKREADEAYAAGVLEILAMEEDWDPELLRPTDVVDASVLADRTREATYASAAERAADDRTWTFGHVIVDEAQELSPMAWRVLMRRCPSRSMTLVGDVAQTGARAGASSWSEVLSPYVAARWRREVLTVNYRTPAEIMAVAADVLAAIDPTAATPTSVRESGIEPRAVAADEDSLVDAAASCAREARDAVLDAEGAGRVAVLAPGERVPALAAALGVAAGQVTDADPAVDLESAVVVCEVGEAKGLEFDAVVLVDPAGVVDASPRGLNDLYVALTRATRSLVVVHPGDLPPVLRRLD
ncbi:HelD family protein [Actinomycetospora cinnamomea]|uniref:DNA helicase IV n=1 Tax=Actinomycetospora cinnamomea TaxID=663609 RepID=A0A2U1F6G8_9PSEU|nr:ATP-binding domain-containing protein [Actinomycetospora cinnamomea]PVZ07742.1 DNA helicase IV [Actinomycetospora cinnamomea]